jgi:hypothetical protein
LAQIVGIVFLVLDYQAMKNSPLPKLEKFTWSPVAAGAAAPAAPSPAPGGVVAPGGN